MAGILRVDSLAFDSDVQASALKEGGGFIKKKHPVRSLVTVEHEHVMGKCIPPSLDSCIVRV